MLSPQRIRKVRRRDLPADPRVGRRSAGRRSMV